MLTILLTSCGTPQSINEDQIKKIQNLESKADKGDSSAQYELGEIYYIGDGVSKNLPKAFILFSKAAEMGLPEAQYSLGYIYKNGIGIEIDEKKSVQWFEAAAKNGVIIAQYNLGMSYLNGIGTDVDLIKAYAWLKIAREHGTADAQNSLLLAENKLDESNLKKANLFYQSVVKEMSKD
jgi:TPR repeat protein